MKYSRGFALLPLIIILVVILAAGLVITNQSPKSETKNTVENEESLVAGNTATLCFPGFGLQSNLSPAAFELFAYAEEESIFGKQEHALRKEESGPEPYFYLQGESDIEATYSDLRSSDASATRTGWRVYERENSITGTKVYVIDAPEPFSFRTAQPDDKDIYPTIVSFIETMYPVSGCPER